MRKSTDFFRKFSGKAGILFIAAFEEFINEKERFDMEMIVGNMRMAEDQEQRVSIGESEQQKKATEGVSERKDMKTRHDVEKQQVSYDAVSFYGDTLSISEAGKAVSSEPGGKQVNGDTTDGIVIRKETEEKEQRQESEVSTVNLSVYTESELKQMYLDGDITRAEYDEEISSRETQD